MSRQTYKILCVGDSITHGSGRESTRFPSYRYPMWKKILANGIDAEFVGPRQGSFEEEYDFEEYMGHTFNNVHFAQFGVKTDPMTDAIRGGELDNIDFDVVFINIGTNDRRDDYARNITEIPKMHEQMITQLRRINPVCIIFLAGLCDNWTPGLNEAIEKKALELNTSESPVFYCPTPQGWIATPESEETFTLDWVHPNLKGCEAMAETYLNELIEKVLK